MIISTLAHGLHGCAQMHVTITFKTSIYSFIALFNVAVRVAFENVETASYVVSPSFTTVVASST